LIGWWEVVIIVSGWEVIKCSKNILPLALKALQLIVKSS
jgi:hypothetical protein